MYECVNGGFKSWPKEPHVLRCCIVLKGNLWSFCCTHSFFAFISNVSPGPPRGLTNVFLPHKASEKTHSCRSLWYGKWSVFMQCLSRLNDHSKCFTAQRLTLHYLHPCLLESCLPCFWRYIASFVDTLLPPTVDQWNSPRATCLCGPWTSPYFIKLNNHMILCTN